MAEKKTTPVRVSVVLKKDHRHEGKNFKAGSKIDVTDGQKQWLKREEVI